MKLHETSDTGGYRITAYGPGFVAVNDVRHQGSLIVTPDRLMSDWAPPSILALEPSAFDAIADLDLEIALLGSGDRHVFPDAGALEPLYRRRVGVEVMTTPAACRTYNILMSEGRKVGALLFEMAEEA